MIVAHFLGTTAFNKLTDGVVIINDDTLKSTYKDIIQVVGNISPLESTSEYAYNKAVREVTGWDRDEAQKFIDDNYLLEYVSYAEVEVAGDSLTIDIEI